MQEVTAAQVRATLSYDPTTGVFRWKERPLHMFAPDPTKTADANYRVWNSQNAGKVTGTLSSDGYITISVFGRLYLAHRLAWLIVTGAWPAFYIDHINLKKSDNRWANLRLASRSQNAANTRVRRDNTSGVKGVCWDKRRRNWYSRIKVNGRVIYLGSFRTAEDAHDAYRIAAQNYYGEYARSS